MSSGNNVKILTVGSASGSIKDLFAKVKAIDAKHGKFDLVLCTGDFFGPPKEEYGEDDEVTQLLNGTLEAPIECYIMQGEYPLPPPVIEKFAKTSGALSSNVFLLHKSGMITTAHGLRIACLGGIYDGNIYSAAETTHGFTSPYFTSQTVERLLSNTMTSSKQPSTKGTSYNSLASIAAATTTPQLLDILLTNTFPSGITALSSAPLPSPAFPPTQPAEPVAEVVRHTKPRYHFVAGGGGEHPPMFWEREPFVWEEEAGRVSRFVSLGAFGGPADASTGKKQRWFYAFSIAPHDPKAPLPARPTNATPNPFTDKAALLQSRKRPHDGAGDSRQPGKKTRVDGEDGKPPSGYKCKICESPDHFIRDCPDRAKPKEGYVCRACGAESEHFIRDCPTKNQVGDTGGRKPREGYVCRACGSELHYIQDCPLANQPQHPRASRKEITPSECWFCLANPGVAKHLIVSIGSECYVSLPKGQIIPTQHAESYSGAKIPSIPGGGHVLIIPITHYPSYSTIPADLADPIFEETKKYLQALKTFYSSYNAHPVSFEAARHSGKGGHAHIQVIPVPKSLSAEKIEDAIITEGRRLGADFEHEEEDAPASDGPRGYFRISLPDGRRLVHFMKDGVPFNIQFGRQVLAGLLGVPERFDWKTCIQTEDEDRADAERFKEAFTQYDPTL
ncbi:nuclear protein [Panus rudis PR-1116 ss-1]|nr:nuclear protein [Panus rudis PR-1116 ss-1]